MTSIPDYIERLGAVIQEGKIREDEPGCAIYLEGNCGASFPELRILELRSAFNEAMHVAVAYYTECAAKAGVESYCLRHRNAGRKSNHPRSLIIESADLHGGVAKDRCWLYCELTFGVDYVRHAAALMEMSVDQFRHDQERRPAMRELGLLL